MNGRDSEILGDEAGLEGGYALPWGQVGTSSEDGPPGLRATLIARKTLDSGGLWRRL